MPTTQVFNAFDFVTGEHLSINRRDVVSATVSEYGGTLVDSATGQQVHITAPLSTFTDWWKAT